MTSNDITTSVDYLETLKHVYSALYAIEGVSEALTINLINTQSKAADSCELLSNNAKTALLEAIAYITQHAIDEVTLVTRSMSIN